MIAIEKAKRVRMPSKRVAGPFSLQSATLACAAVDALQKQAAVSEVRKRRKYRSQKVQKDVFFSALRNAESLGLLVVLERVAGVDRDALIVPRSWYLHIDGVSHRLESIQGATDFLNGFCACLAVTRNLVRFSGEQPQADTASHVMGKV